jgi:large subunit ribosomal protein L19
MSILQKIEQEQVRTEIAYRVGDQVRVHVRIKEGDKERIQVYEGVIIALKRGANRASFTVRKVSYGVGVERVFPLHSPSVEKVEVVSHGKVRRARLFYLRELRGKKARIKERDMRQVAANQAAAAARAEAAAAAAAAKSAGEAG